MNEDFSPAEIGLVRYLRSLDERTQKAIRLWFYTGDTTLLLQELTYHRPIAA